MLSACGFVRVRRLRDADGSPHYQASVLSFDNDGFGRVAHAFGGEAATFLFLRRELAGRANVVMLGAEAKLVARSLPSGSRIVERRSALSLRVMEVGLVGAIRDESQRLAAQLRETPSHADALGAGGSPTRRRASSSRSPHSGRAVRPSTGTRSARRFTPSMRMRPAPSAVDTTSPTRAATSPADRSAARRRQRRRVTPSASARRPC